MEQVVELLVPLKADIGAGPNWAEAKAGPVPACSRGRRGL